MTTNTGRLTSIVLKAWMGLTGLYLVLFVCVHVVGNLQLFLPENLARPNFNAYSQLLTSSLLIRVAGWLTYASVVVHAVVSMVLAYRHRKVRSRYAMDQPGLSSPWYARSMGWLGAVILVFLVLHMQAFWYRYHWGEIGLDSAGNKDLYAVVVAAFCEPWIVALYVGSMLALGFHLQHGVAAALRSLGVFSPRITRGAPQVAATLAWIVAVTFAAMPIYIYVAFSGQAP